MAKKVVIGNAELWLGDCLEILLTLDKVDCVITDPPYGTGAAPRGGKIAGTINLASGQSWEWDNFSTDWVGLIGDIPAAVFCGLAMVGKVYSAIHGDSQIVYVKTNPNPLGSSVEICVTKGFPKKGLNHISAYNAFNGQVHPTQKPIEVMQFIVSAINCQTILDPFMGSGTTGVACANLGRKFIGIEIEEKYFDIACERITAAQAQLRLFA